MKSNRERQAEYRERKKKEGKEEVRGIWMPKSKHKAIKLVINNMYRSE